MKSDLRSNESFEKIDNTFIEMNKILSDLSQTKLLLQKTRNIDTKEEFKEEKYDSNNNPPIKVKSQVTFETKPRESLLTTLDESNHSKNNDTYLTNHSPIIRSESRRSSSLNRNSLNLVNYYFKYYKQFML